MESYNKKQFIYKMILLIVFVVCVTVVISFAAACNLVDSNYLLMKENDKSQSSNESIEEITEDLKSFRKLIDKSYKGDIDEQKIKDETIKGYINGLGDEYSEYMTAEEWNEYQINAFGNYVGIGIYMSQDTNGNIVVVEPIDGSPAKEVGLQSGDIISEVNGESTVNQTTNDVANKIKGEEGTTVNLKIVRGTENLTFDIKRKAIEIYPVKNEMKANNIGYIKLSTFDEGCSDEFKNAFENLKNQGAQKLIIDLRDNTGGIVDEALNIADLIVPKDKIMLITVDNKDKKEITKAKLDPVIDMDVVVLVNEYSASASEILVGCLKDNGEATVVGTKTYGKGVIQNVFSLSDGSVLKLTTAEYYTPNETKINKIGIEPDQKVEQTEEKNGEPEIDEQLNKAIEILSSKK